MTPLVLLDPSGVVRLFVVLASMCDQPADPVEILGDIQLSREVSMSHVSDVPWA